MNERKCVILLFLCKMLIIHYFHSTHICIAYNRVKVVHYSYNQVNLALFHNCDIIFNVKSILCIVR